MPGEKGAPPVERALLDPDGTFPARLAADRVALAEHARNLDALPQAAREDKLREIANLAHRLAGAAGTFGYGAVGDAAIALEDMIVYPDATLSRQAATLIRQGIEALVSALDDGLRASGD